MARLTFGVLFALRLLSPATAAAQATPVAQATPEATPTPGVHHAAQEPDKPDIPTLIVDAAYRWGLDAQQMLRVGWCESRWDPAARGPGGAAGVFQFIPDTWAWASTAVGLGDASPYDARANVEAAAWLMATQGPHHWTCR
ncbi:MAG: transglycosylase SLT domain-containing protein [Chloroflexota bacterium]